MLENVGNAITRLPMDRLGRNLGGRVASNRRLYRKTFSSVLVVTANRTVHVLVLWGVEIKNIHTFDEIWMILCHCITKIKSVRNTVNINTKNLRSFISVKAHCSMTHLKQQKSFGLFYSTPLGHGCNIWFLLHPRPSGVPTRNQMIFAVLDVSLNNGP